MFFPDCFFTEYLFLTAQVYYQNLIVYHSVNSENTYLFLYYDLERFLYVTNTF